MTQAKELQSRHHGYMEDKKAYLQRMKRIEGQARGIAKMIDEEKYYIDVLTQISALARAIQGVASGLLEDHLKHCVLNVAKLSDEAAKQKLMKQPTRSIGSCVPDQRAIARALHSCVVTRSRFQPRDRQPWGATHLRLP